MSFDVTCCSAEIVTGLIEPSPPRWLGSSRRFHTGSLRGTWPVSAGINCDQNADSSG